MFRDGLLLMHIVLDAVGVLICYDTYEWPLN